MIYFVIYLAGAITSFRFLAPRFLSRHYDSQVRQWGKEAGTRYAKQERGEMILVALAVALFWPLGLPFYALLIFAKSWKFTQIPQVLAEDERAELERLRKKARELAQRYDLPMGDEKP